MKTIQLIALALVWAIASMVHAQDYKVMVNFNGTYSPWEAGIIAQWMHSRNHQRGFNSI